MRIVAGCGLLAAAFLLLGLGIGVAETWFYVFAWYPILLAVDGAARRRFGRSLARTWPDAVSLFGWSVPIWMAYELANLRLQNWYYVLLPAHPVERWAGVTIAFATVLPALFGTAYAIGPAPRAAPEGDRPSSLSSRWRRAAAVSGVAMTAAALVWPRWCSPLIWGGGFLVAESIVDRTLPRHSLIRDLSAGRWARTGRLLLAGLLVGLVWEALNGLAGARWIYTVPFLETTKVFEMPPLGFLGFPVFTLSAWSLYHALCGLGVARDGEGHPVRAGRTAVAVALAVALVAVTLGQLDRRTVSSTTWGLTDMPGLGADAISRLRRAGLKDPADLLASDGPRAAEAAGIPAHRVAELVETIRLARLRGLGPGHAAELRRAGITSVCALAAADPGAVWEDIHALFRGLGPRPTAAEVRVWHRAAVRACRSGP